MIRPFSIKFTACAQDITPVLDSTKKQKQIVASWLHHSDTSHITFYDSKTFHNWDDSTDHVYKHVDKAYILVFKMPVSAIRIYHQFLILHEPYIIS